MYYGRIKKCDIANGEGVRVSLFVSGCTHHCPGCFNADTWNFKYGSEYTDQTEKEILEALSPSYINGLNITWRLNRLSRRNQNDACRTSPKSKRELS